MDIRSFRRREEGSVAVIAALCMTVLIGAAAFAVDFGMLASCRQAMQNAADAAALAAAADLGAGYSEDTVTATAEAYCALNGFDPADGDVEIDVQISGETVEVALRREVPMGFSAVLTGEHRRAVSTSAAAEAVSIFGSYPFAMFAGQNIEDGLGITVTGSSIRINGDIHSNSYITIKDPELGANVVASAVDPGKNKWVRESMKIDMPSFRSFEKAVDKMTEVVRFDGDVVKSSGDGFQELIGEALEKYAAKMGSSKDYLTDGLYIQISGSLTFNGKASTAYYPEFPIVLIVNGDIDLNGARLESTKQFPVAVMSKTGNITVNGGGATFTGILYAPEGNVTLNGNDAQFVGSIVAQNIRKNGGKITVAYEEEADHALPKTKVHLIA